MAVRFHGHLIQNRTSIPLGIGDKVMERLVLTIGHNFLHALQALQVHLSLENNTTRPAVEE
jgi:hypothetical protein